MTQPALPAPLQLVLNTTGITYEPHSRSEQDGQLTLVGRLIRPEVEPLDVVIYASGDLEAFGVHLWPAGQTDPPGDAAPGVLFEVVETWTFIDPVFFLLSPIQALRLLAPLDSSDALTIPASDHVPPLRFAVTNDLYLKAGELRHSLTSSRPYLERQEEGLLLHWKALINFSRRVWTGLDRR